MIIKRFDEFISEGLWNKGLNRNNKGEKRKEDIVPLDKICEYIGQVVSEELKIDYNKDICTWEINEILSEKTKEYKIKIDVYNIEVLVNISEIYFNDEEHIVTDICDSIYGNYLQNERKTKTYKLIKYIFDSLVIKYNIEYYKKVFNL